MTLALQREKKLDEHAQLKKDTVGRENMDAVLLVPIHCSFIGLECVWLTVLACVARGTCPEVLDMHVARRQLFRFRRRRSYNLLRCFTKIWYRGGSLVYSLMTSRSRISESRARQMVCEDMGTMG